VNSINKKYIKVLSVCLLVIYMAALAYVCFFSEKYGRTHISSEYRYNLTPFKEIKRFLNYREALGLEAFVINLFGNIFVFSPFGFFLPVASRKCRKMLKMTGLTFLLSLFIETIQLVCRVGSFDVDDLILNTFGGLLGYIVFRIFDIVYGSIRRKKGTGSE